MTSAGIQGPPRPRPRPEEQFPRILGPFRLLSKLGQGGVGVVYAAEVIATGQRVALKFLLDLGRLEASQVERFRREGELAARLTHPGIVRIHDAGQIEGTPYLAYELVEDAKTLDVAARELDVLGRLKLVRQVAEAVASAHALGIVHRDLKQLNVLVDTEGRARVCDFGLATAGDLTRLTRSQAFLGTPSHMAPEQLEGGSSERARAPTVDVWALGVILFECLTGRPVFEARTMVELLAQVSTAKVLPPSHYVETGRGVDAVVLRALDRDNTRRYPSAKELVADLDALVENRDPLARRSERARQARFAVIGTLIVLILSLLGWQGVRRAQASGRAKALLAAENRLATIELRPSLVGEIDALAAVDEELKEFADQGELRQRISVRMGLALLAQGERAKARGLLEFAEGAPEAPVLRAAYALETGELPAPADAEALANSPLRFRELNPWRAALGLVENWDPALARRALPPLKRLGPAGRRWRVTLLARLGRIPEAEPILAELAGEGELPPGVAEAVGLGGLAAAFETGDSAALLAAAGRVPRQATPLLSSWRRSLALALAKASAETMQASLDKEPDPRTSKEEIEGLRTRLLAILSGIVRLDAGVTTEKEIASRFAAASAIVASPRRDCVELLSAAHPNYAEVQVPLLALRMAGDTTIDSCAQALPIAARAAACTKGKRRYVVGVFQARARWRLKRYTEGIEGLEVLLTEAPSESRAALRFERARCLRGLGRYKEALEEFDWVISKKGLSQVDSTLARFERGQVLTFLGDEEKAALDMAVFLRETSGNHGSGLYRLAARVLWTRDRKAYARSLLQMRRLSKRSKSPAMQAWVIRAALLQAQAGDFDQASESLAGASSKMISSERWIKEAAAQAGAIAKAFEAGDQSLTALEALVQAFDESETEYGVVSIDLPEPFVPQVAR